MLDYVIKRDMGNVRDIRLEKTCEVEGLEKTYKVEGGIKSRRVDIAFVKKVGGEEVPYIIIEVKTGVEAHVAGETLAQVDRDAWLIMNHKCTAYYYFDQAPSDRAAMQYLGKIRQVYTDLLTNEHLNGKMFVIIGGGEPVAPTDQSLDAYILNPPEGWVGMVKIVRSGPYARIVFRDFKPGEIFNTVRRINEGREKGKIIDVGDAFTLPDTIAGVVEYGSKGRGTKYLPFIGENVIEKIVRERPGTTRTSSHYRTAGLPAPSK